jgi:aryl-alcohol dehydrogenase-like predicted oxidoreductase
MKLRNLGKSGLKVSVVGLGCNNFGGRVDLETARAVVDKALDLGINLLDTADVYGERGGSEEALGQILGERRKSIVLATKFGIAMGDAETMKGASRRYIVGAVEASLRRLRTDYIDLYQVHRFDPETPVEETLRALDDLVHQGKVRYLGCSNFPGWAVADAHWTAATQSLNSFVSCQDEYSLLVRDLETDRIPAMERFGLGLLPYFPLASGLLTGKYQRNAAPAPGTRFAKMHSLGERYMTDKNWDIVEGLKAFSAERGRSLTALAFSWLAAQSPVASVIAGATRVGQVEENARSAEWELSAADLAEIDRITGKNGVT